MTLPTYVAPIGTLIAGAVGGYLVGKSVNKPKTAFGYDPMVELGKYISWITDKDDWRKGGEKVADLVIELRQHFSDATVKLARKIKMSDKFVKADIFRLKRLASFPKRGM
jgi:hypothetical protein